MGNIETVHVKNTGRCKELLIPGVKVILEMADNPSRKTKYDLITVWKAGLGWITKPAEGKNLIDGELYVQQRAEGTKKKLIGFELQERAIPRKDYEVTDGKGNVIGVVTSGCMSPCRGIGVGMAHVKPEFAKIDTPVYIKIRNKEVPALVVKMPFRH